MNRKVDVLTVGIYVVSSQQARLRMCLQQPCVELVVTFQWGPLVDIM